jgi:coproporphyrinogen III oxidase-like Fe-S oxidoreductase
LSESRETLSHTDRYNEAVMTGLRTAHGIHPEDLREAHGLRPDVVDPQAWSHALDCGDLIALEGGRFRIPEAQWITGDRVAASLFHVA